MLGESLGLGRRTEGISHVGINLALKWDLQMRREEFAAFQLCYFVMAPTSWIDWTPGVR